MVTIVLAWLGVAASAMTQRLDSGVSAAISGLRPLSD
jgi:hypothetical protein